MTPRRLDWRVIQPRLAKMTELLDQLRDLGAFDAQRLRGEPVAALAVERILTLLVDLAFAVNNHVTAAMLGKSADTYAASFPLAATAGLIDEDLAQALRPSAGTRNVLVHGYLDVDHGLIATAIPCALVDYASYVAQAAAWLSTRQDGESAP